MLCNESIVVRRPVLRPQQVALTWATQNSQNEEGVINKDGKYFSRKMGWMAMDWMAHFRWRKNHFVSQKFRDGRNYLMRRRCRLADGVVEPAVIGNVHQPMRARTHPTCGRPRGVRHWLHRTCTGIQCGMRGTAPA